MSALPTHGEHRTATTITLGPSSRALRRELGVLAWGVLEDVAFDTRLDHRGRAVAITSVRRVAANLGINKDTAARALARLGAVGLLHRDPGTGGYILATDTVSLLGWQGCPTEPDAHAPDHQRPLSSDTMPRYRRTTGPSTSTINEQTSLFEHDSRRP